ncbi:diacylglycerol/lipid kinase family protein [Vagococcus elongatus]|nr:diacylglycerol kinase family protein [Vagococcus elongatus]
MNYLFLHIIANEHSGGGKGKLAAAEVKNYLDEKKVPYQFYRSEYAGHAIELAGNLLQTTLKPWSKDLQAPYPLLVVLGGDGTLHEVTNALGDHFDIPMGYIPSGSGNDFARSTGIPRESLEALKLILATSKPQELFILSSLDKTTGQNTLITNNLGIGLDASIVAAANQSEKKQSFNRLQMGAFIYLFSAIKVLFQQEGFPLSVKINGEAVTFERAFLVTCTKHPYFGGGVKIAPNASSFEQNLELIVVERIPLYKILYLVFLLFRGKHLESKNVYHFNAKKISLATSSKEYGQMSGEIIPKQGFDVTLSTVKRFFWF